MVIGWQIWKGGSLCVKFHKIWAIFYSNFCWYLLRFLKIWWFCWKNFVRKRKNRVLLGIKLWKGGIQQHNKLMQKRMSIDRSMMYICQWECTPTPAHHPIPHRGPNSKSILRWHVKFLRYFRQILKFEFSLAYLVSASKTSTNKLK